MAGSVAALVGDRPHRAGRLSFQPVTESEAHLESSLTDPELERLMEAHPALFNGELPQVFSHLPAGWYRIVDQLCDALEDELGPQAWRQFQPRQIKEKFGTLRFYYRFVSDDDPDDNDVEQAPAEVPRAPSDACRERVRALVSRANASSQETCQRCGEPGSPCNVDGYLSTLCDLHHQAAMARSDMSRK